MCSLKSVNVFLALKANLCKIFFSFELEGFFSGFFSVFFFFFILWCWCVYLSDCLLVHVAGDVCACVGLSHGDGKCSPLDTFFLL